MNVKLHLRTLAIQSWLALALGPALAIVSLIEGEKAGSSHFAYLFAGLIGVYAHQLIASLCQRVSELESRADTQETQGPAPTEPKP